MKLSEELRVVHMFLREATLTPFKQTPNYHRFKQLCMNIFHYVGLERNITQMPQRFFQKVCRDAVRAVVTRIVN
jgi:hypothetical protein